MRSLICPKCGNYLERGEYICSRCGTAVLQEDRVLRTAAPARRITAEREETVPCPGCGSEERASLRYCSRCGTRLTALTPTPALTKKRSRLGLWLGLAAVLIAVGIALLYLKNGRFSEGSRGAITLESRSLSAESTAETEQTGSAAFSQEQAEELLQRTYGCTVQLRESTSEGFTFDCIKGERAAHVVGTVTVAPDGSIRVLSGMQSIIGRVDPERLAELLSEAGGKANVSCAVVDLATGEFTGTDALNTPMSSSVLIDVPILYTVAQKAADGSLTMEDSVSVVTGGGGRGSLNAFKGKSLTVSEILQYIFLYSSNDATNSMIDFLGKDAIAEYCRKGGYESIQVANHIGKTSNSSDNLVSTADLCRILDELYNSASGPIDRDFLQHNLVLSGSDATANKGLSKKLSGGLIGCFNAFTDKKYNEIMWVEYADCAYAVAFMGNGANLEKLRRIAADVGAYVDEALRTEPTVEPAPTLPED